MATVRAKFWPLRLRDIARKVTHECIPCFRSRPRFSEQIMADLPSVRVSPTLPFLNTGVDFCGPFYLRPPTRKAAPVKVFVAVFVCLSTKAIHLELVGNLSTDSFIASLKRFAARRGVPQTIYCDNATNFVGARRTLNEFLQLFRTQQSRLDVTRQCSAEGIRFAFIPPRSPHFGGIWEAAVKSLKTHLRRTLANALVTTEQFHTLLTQVEALLNSRPLTQLSSSPEDLEVLTPAHFLVHRPLTAIPEPSYEEQPSNRLTQWQTIQDYLRRIWKRWSSEYLSGLQQRTQWTHRRDNIRIGTNEPSPESASCPFPTTNQLTKNPPSSSRSRIQQTSDVGWEGTSWSPHKLSILFSFSGPCLLRPKVNNISRNPDLLLSVNTTIAWTNYVRLFPIRWSTVIELQLVIQHPLVKKISHRQQ